MLKIFNHNKLYIKYFANIQSTKIFDNSNANHAVAVFRVLFETAQGIVRIFARDLCCDITNTNEYVDALQKFIKEKNGIVKILLERRPSDTELETLHIFDMLRNIGKNYEIKETIERATLKYGGLEPQQINFTTGDDSIYRLEYNIDEFKAKCCFNSEKVTGRLNTLFDKSFSDNKAIPILLRA